MSEDFDFEEGDRVLVRVRENGTRGWIVGKFEADVRGFRTVTVASSDAVVLDPPWDSVLNSPVKLRPYEAEFEVIDGDE